MPPASHRVTLVASCQKEAGERGSAGVSYYSESWHVGDRVFVRVGIGTPEVRIGDRLEVGTVSGRPDDPVGPDTVRHGLLDEQVQPVGEHDLYFDNDEAPTAASVAVEYRLPWGQSVHLSTDRPEVGHQVQEAERGVLARLVLTGPTGEGRRGDPEGRASPRPFTVASAVRGERT
ncbi:hypothetical protein [Rathayibacter sp. VKM Ac-2760]|uniref:hypothetical protein n=1 Tax=Rathayibacter sp. VKM Ac-2760 TaxID=2609253 RepID=UPI001315CFCE|nr:hypothetical protein [Rathayibacter sp. VKM Ac-2760]QHC57550.1 hypothetical protein GSU72_02345 [Rathayibacter sp. VKM Ac-2760]